MNILLVEDDPDMRELLSCTLTDRGHSVTACSDGKKCWEAYQTETYPLIFLDWMLPDMDGLEICKKIRAHDPGNDCVILMITARTEPGDLEQVLDAGADDYIAKPFTPELLDIRTTIAERLVVQRHTLNCSQSQIRALIETMPDFVCFKDQDGRWLTINSAAKETFQLSDMSWQGQTDMDLIKLHPQLEEILLTNKASDDITWQKRSYYDYDQTINDANGVPHIYAIRKVPIYEPDGKRRCILMTGRDVTERRKAFDEMSKTREIAIQANKAKSQFLGRISHELRTPLNAILGFAQIIELQPDETPLARMRGHVKKIVGSGWYLVRIINDLLDLAAIEANKIEVQLNAVELDIIINDSIEVITPLAQERKIVIQGPREECKDMHVLADSFRLKQVILNMLSNAVKYNRQGGEVKVECARVPPDRIRISVIDNGSGIPDADLPKIFEAFSRLHKRSYDIEGAGIGLSIAKQLTELMGGTVGVESTEGKGSNFWIELQEETTRVADDMDIRKTKPGHKSNKNNMTTVLYIEDSPSHTDLMQSIIDDMGNIVLLTAHTPTLGIELANAHQPDIILSDICLPGMDGYELLEKLKNNKRTSHIPVIAISAIAVNSEIEAGLRAGFRRYFTKPIHVAEFKETLNEILVDEASLSNTE